MKLQEAIEALNACDTPEELEKEFAEVLHCFFQAPAAEYSQIIKARDEALRRMGKRL